MVQNNYSGGNATVLTPFLSGITNTVAKQQQRIANQEAQEAKRLQEEQQQLTDIVKKVNINGVQKQHLPEITSKLEKIYDTYYKASKTESRQEKLALRLELEKGITELGADVALSKDYGQKFAKIGEQFATKPELYSAEARKQYAENFNKPLSQLNGTETNLQTYISPDTSILGKTEDPLIKGLWTRASEKTTYGKTVGVGQTGDRVTETFKTKSINPDDVGKELFRAYGDNSGYKNIIDLQAEQLGMTPQQVLLERTKAIVDLNKPMVEQGQFRNSKPRQETSGGSSDNGGFVIEKDYDLNFGIDSRTNKQRLTIAREYVALPSTPIVAAGKFDMYDENGDKYSGGNTTEKINLVSIGTFPVARKGVKVGGKDVPVGSIVTKKFALNNRGSVNYVPKAVVNITDGSGQTATTKTYFADPKEVIARTKLTTSQEKALSAYNTVRNNTDNISRGNTTSQPKATQPKKMGGIDLNGIK